MFGTKLFTDCSHHLYVIALGEAPMAGRGFPVAPGIHEPAIRGRPRGLRTRVEYLDVVVIERYVGGDDRQAFGTSLCNEQPVEWVLMVLGQ